MRLSTLLILTFMMSFNTCKNQSKQDFLSNNTVLFPFLSTSGQYGFCDINGKLIIHPEYDDAHLFKNGFAVVAKNEKYGVINKDNQVVIPLKYPAIRLVAHNGIVLAITKKEYNAWWRFWNWKMLPEWNLLSSGNSGPFLVTKVPRAKWCVIALPEKKKLFSDRRTDQYTIMKTHQYWKDDWIPDRSVPQDINIVSNSDLLAVNHKIYDLKTKKRFKIKRNDFQSFINDSTYISKSGKAYRTTTAREKHKRINNENYRQTQGISLKTAAGDSIYIPKYGEMGRAYPIIRTQLFINQKGQTFLSDNFSKSFPKVVYNFQSAADTVSAKQIFKEIVMLANLPHSPYFLILSSAGKTTKNGAGWYCYFLKENGHWKTDIPIYQGPQEVLNNGAITFEHGNCHGILNTDFKFQSLPLIYIQPVAHHPKWYMGKDTLTEKYGIYDIEKKAWQVPAHYDYLQQQVNPNVAIYNIIKDDQTGDSFGLINIVDNKRITPPVYKYITTSGRVVRNINDVDQIFYINLKTGKEYRTK